MTMDKDMILEKTEILGPEGLNAEALANPNVVQAVNIQGQSETPESAVLQTNHSDGAQKVSITASKTSSVDISSFFTLKSALIALFNYKKLDISRSKAWQDFASASS